MRYDEWNRIKQAEYQAEYWKKCNFWNLKFRNHFWNHAIKLNQRRFYEMAFELTIDLEIKTIHFFFQSWSHLMFLLTIIPDKLTFYWLRPISFDSFYSSKIFLNWNHFDPALIIYGLPCCASVGGRFIVHPSIFWIQSTVFREDQFFDELCDLKQTFALQQSFWCTQIIFRFSIWAYKSVVNKS